MTHTVHSPLNDDECNATVAGYGDHTDAENAVRTLEQGGYDMT